MFRSLLLIFCIWFGSIVSAQGQYLSYNRRAYDSLLKAGPPANKVGQGERLLVLAQLIWDSLPEKAFVDIMKAQQIAIAEGDLALKANSRLVIGLAYHRRQQFALAYNNYNAALQIFTKINNEKGILLCYYRMAGIIFGIEEYSQSIEYCQKGLAWADRIGAYDQKANLYKLIAQCYQQLSDTANALVFFKKSLEFCRYTKSESPKNKVQISIGALLISQNRNDEALAYYNTLMNTFDTADLFHLGVLYTNIAHIYQQKRNYQKAVRYDIKALKVRQRIKGGTVFISSLINLGGDYLLLGKPDSGRYYMNKGLKLAHLYNLKNFKAHAYFNLYKYNLARKNHREAFENYKRYSDVSDSINVEKASINVTFMENNNVLQQIQESAMVLEKQKGIQQLKMKSQKLQFVFVQMLSIIAAVSVIGFLIYLVYNQIARRNLQVIHDKLKEQTGERKSTERLLREKEQQYRFLSKHSLDLIMHVDAQMNWIFVSPSVRTIFGYEPEEMRDLKIKDLLHPDFHDLLDSKLQELMQAQTAQHITCRIKRKDLKELWVEMAINPLLDHESGDFRGAVVVIRDIHERKLKELEVMENTIQTENLLKEIHHRVKNNFAILVSLINMQMAQSSSQEVQQSLTNLQLRIRTMALVHEMLYRSKDFEKIPFQEYLRSVVSVISGTFRRENTEVIFEADEATMNIETLIPLGLIVNELISNAYKHAFSENQPGTIWIGFKADPYRSFYTLTIRDNGKGFPDQISGDENPATMGLQIVKLLCKQIEARLEFRNDPGACFTISFSC